MSAGSRLQRVRWIVLIMGVLIMGVLIGCGLVVAGAYRYLYFHVYTYEAVSTFELNGGPAVVSISPQNRVKNNYPDRLIGPPYWVTLHVGDRTQRTVTAAILHSIRIVKEDGSQLEGEIKIPLHRREPHLDYVWLNATFSRGDWGQRPSLIAVIETVFPSGGVLETITIPLRPKHTATLSILP